MNNQGWFCLILAFVFLLVESSANDNISWSGFQRKYRLRFRSSQERGACYQKFLKTRQEINEHNIRYERGEETYRKALNRFICMDSKIMKSYSPPSRSQQLKHTVELVMPRTYATIPDEYDFRNDPCSTPVVNQMDCGCCYVTSALESMSAGICREINKKVALSIQYVVDCSTYTYGCRYGNMINTYRCVNDTGIPEDHIYPYVGYEGECNASALENYDIMKKHKCVVKRILRASPGNDEQMRSLIAKYGVVSAGIACDDSFTTYKSGIYKPDGCNPDELVHALAVVGYTKDYWICKNSWDTDWGMDGYIYITREVDNPCGLTTFVSVPIIQCANCPP